MHPKYCAIPSPWQHHSKTTTMSCFSFALGDILDERDLLFWGGHDASSIPTQGGCSGAGMEGFLPVVPWRTIGVPLKAPVIHRSAHVPCAGGSVGSPRRRERSRTIGLPEATGRRAFGACRRLLLLACMRSLETGSGTCECATSYDWGRKRQEFRVRTFVVRRALST